MVGRSSSKALWRLTAYLGLFVTVSVLRVSVGYFQEAFFKSSAPRAEDQCNVSSIAAGVECRYVLNHCRDDGDFCTHVSDFCPSDSVINYQYIYTCAWSSGHALLIILLIFELVYLFFLLGISAEKYLCPALAYISDSLHVPHDVAGITFLALGNGSADVFGTFAAVKQYSYGISVGALLGAGLFVQTIVLAAVALVSEARVQKLPFLRDAGFYLVGIVLFFFFLLDGSVAWWEAVIMLLFYLVYVVASSIMSLRLRRRQAPRLLATDETDNEMNAVDDVGNDDLGPFEADDSELESIEIMDEDLIITRAPHVSGVQCIDTALAKWKRKTHMKRIVWLFMAFLKLPLSLTCPDTKWRRWDRVWTIATFAMSPFFLLWACNVINMSIGGFPIWVLGILIAVVLMILVWFFTKNLDSAPSGWRALTLSLWTFVMSIMWIYFQARELVGILRMFGQVLNISDVILGATVLAWGGSVGDLVSNVQMAKAGYPEMSIAATFGGPLFNLLLGSAVSLLFMTVSDYPTQYPTPLRLDSVITTVFLFINTLAIVFVVHFVGKYTVPRKFSIFLILIYVLYDVFLVLLGVGVLDNGRIN